MNMLQVSPEEEKYSIIFAHVSISIIHQICFLSITIKDSSYDLTVTTKQYKISEKICVQYNQIYDANPLISFNYHFMLEDYVLQRLNLIDRQISFYMTR